MENIAIMFLTLGGARSKIQEDYPIMEVECIKCHEWTGPEHHFGCDKSNSKDCAWHIKDRNG